MYIYLSVQGEENIASGVHEEDLPAASLLIIIDSKSEFAFGVEHGAAIPMEHQRLHPYCECL